MKCHYAGLLVHSSTQTYKFAAFLETFAMPYMTAEVLDSCGNIDGWQLIDGVAVRSAMR